MKRRKITASGVVGKWITLSKDGTVSEFLKTANDRGSRVRGMTAYFEDGSYIEYTRDTDREEAITHIKEAIFKYKIDPPVRISPAVEREIESISNSLKGAFL